MSFNNILQVLIRTVFFALILLFFGTLGVFSLVILFVLGLVLFLLGNPGQVHVYRNRPRPRQQFRPEQDENTIEVEYKIEDEDLK